MKANLTTTRSQAINYPEYRVVACTSGDRSSKMVVLLKWGIDTVYTRQCLYPLNLGESVPLIHNSGTNCTRRGHGQANT